MIVVVFCGVGVCVGHVKMFPVLWMLAMLMLVGVGGILVLVVVFGE